MPFAAPTVGQQRLVRSSREDQSRNGVRVIVYRSEDGSVVEADCNCFGNPMGIEVGKDTYVENLEELVWELHSALELTVYDIEDVGARGDTICKAQRLWDEYCGCRARYYDSEES